jgi:uroporphyrinogen decarboxylase
MTSKERVITTLQGGIPDQVPIGEFAVDYDAVEKIIGHETYFRAKAKSQIAFWDGRHDEVAESYLKDHIELHERLELDIVNFCWATWEIPQETDDAPPRKIDDTTWEDKYGRIFKYSDVTQDITCVEDPVQKNKTLTLAEYEAEPEPVVRDARSAHILDTVIHRFKDEKFICGPCSGEIWIHSLGLGFEESLMELIQNPDAVKTVLNYVVKQQNLADEAIIHPDSDGILWGADYGFKTGTFISPQMFKEIFLEPIKARVQNIHEKHGKYLMKHCCGNINGIMEMFLECGFDAYQSIQPTAHMDICEIKKQYGDTITLWGGVAVENIISGTADDVRQDVRRAMACAKPGGRFILGSSHSIAVGSNFDNFMAMLDEHHALCRY